MTLDKSSNTDSKSSINSSAFLSLFFSESMEPIFLTSKIFLSAKIYEIRSLALYEKISLESDNKEKDFLASGCFF